MNTQWQKFYDKAFDWILKYGPRIIVAIIIFIIGQWLIRFIRNRLRVHMGKKDVDHSLRPFFQSLIFTSLQVALVFLVLQIIGIQLTVFAAVIAAFGAAVGLALSGTLQNFASGILILLLKPFTVGDNIVSQGFEGTVTSIQIFYTIITTFDKRTVVVPNSKLSNEVIINITLEGSRRLDIEIKLKYDQDLQKIKEVIQQTVASAERVLKEPAVRIGVSEFTDDGYKIVVNLWLNAHGFEDAKLLINEQIVMALKNAGIMVAK